MIVRDQVHSRTLWKLLCKVRVESKVIYDLDDSSLGLEDWIPEELLTEEEKQKHSKRIVLTADETKDFYSVFKQLRRDDRTEYLDNKELKDRLWYLVCDVFADRDLYKSNVNKLKERISTFLSDICKPIELYEAMFRVENLHVQNQFSFWDCSVGKYDRNWLIAWGLNPDRPLYDEKVIAEFENQTVIVVSVEANNGKVAVEKARKKAATRLNALQVYLSDAPSIQDEDLLFELSEWIAFRKTNNPQTTLSSFSTKRKPRTFEFSRGFAQFFEERNKHLTSLEGLLPEMKDIAERAIYWIGNSIAEHDLDQKVIALCTAMETLLTDISDERKGEAIAYRMVLLESILDEGFFYPAKILLIYVLRSNVIHGKSKEEATQAEYGTMLTATKRTLNGFIRIGNLQGFKKRSELINFLEASEYSGQLVTWLKGCEDQRSGEILSALQSAIDKRLGNSSCSEKHD